MFLQKKMPNFRATPAVFSGGQLSNHPQRPHGGVRLPRPERYTIFFIFIFFKIVFTEIYFWFYNL